VRSFHLRKAAAAALTVGVALLVAAGLGPGPSRAAGQGRALPARPWAFTYLLEPFTA